MKKIIIPFIILFLAACTTPGKRCRMHELLLQAQRQNQEYTPFISDSIGKVLVEYYDRYGNANEQMLAHYILGCMYRDLGEAPRALQCYQDAVMKADTTSSKCNDTLLSRIHSQMSGLYYEQFLPEKSLEESMIAERYAWKIKDTLTALINYEWQSKAYQQMGNVDTALTTRKKCLQLYQRYGYQQQAQRLKPLLIRSLIEHNDLKEARQLIQECDNTDNLSNSALYNYIKGMYYVKTGMLVSADFCFRKVSPKNLNDSLALCNGLYELFRTTQKRDSIIKYADRYQSLLKRTFEESSASNMQKVNALYNYSRLQKIADLITIEAEHYKTFLIVTVFVFLLILGFTFYGIAQHNHRRKEKIRILTDEYRSTLEKIQREQSEINTLTDAKNTLLIEEKERFIIALQAKIKRMQDDKPYLLDDRLMSTEIYHRFKNAANGLQGEIVQEGDWQELRKMMDAMVPALFQTINLKHHPVKTYEYDFCILVRLHFSNSEICHLCNMDSARVSTIRKRLLKRIYKVDGTPKEFDERIARIC